MSFFKRAWRWINPPQDAPAPPYASIVEESTVSLKTETLRDDLGNYVVNVESLRDVAIRTKEGYLIRLWTEWDPSATFMVIDGHGSKVGDRGRKKINLREFMWRDQYAAAKLEE